MKQHEMEEALNRSNDQKEAQAGASAVALILTVVFAYLSPTDFWYHGENIGFSNVWLFLAIYAVLTIILNWLLKKSMEQNNRNQSKA